MPGSDNRYSITVIPVRYISNDTKIKYNVKIMPTRIRFVVLFISHVSRMGDDRGP